MHVLAKLGQVAGCLGFIGGGQHPLSRWSYIMADPVEVHVWHRFQGGDPFFGLQERLAKLSLTPNPDYGPFQGGWAGLLSYELGHAFENLPEANSKTLSAQWPDVWLGLYDTLAIFDAQNCKAWVLSWGLSTHGRPDTQLAISKADDFKRWIETEAGRPEEPVNPATHVGLSPVLTREEMESRIARTIDYIHAGDVFQANLSARFSGNLPEDDTPLALFSRLMSRHPSPFAAYLNLGDMVVASHSPERFMSRTADGVLETRPIKGTAMRHKDPDLDARQAETLLSSVKDRAENLMIVDLMRNDLSRVCLPGSVRVPRLCALESFSTVHHLVSDVRGQQRPGLGFFDALRASFPPGSITGAPKVRAMEIISELEGEPRGPWCGSMIRVGFDGAADSNVLIRTAACQKRGQIWQIDARAGAGIVADSEPALEYDEILMKVRALRLAASRGSLP